MIKTRSGIENLSNDAEGSWKQSTPDGNFIHFDGQGNINVNAPKNMTFTAGENISITAGENVNVKAGNNISETAGVNIVQSATADYSLFASNIMEVAGEARSSKAKKVTESAEGINKQADKNTVNLHSKKQVTTNSGEKGTGH